MRAARVTVLKGPAAVTVEEVEEPTLKPGHVLVDVHDDPAWFTVALIPTTLAATTLGDAPVGTPVNLEVDVLAKYVERLLTHAAPEPADDRVEA